jgi:hypothetical protein
MQNHLNVEPAPAPLPQRLSADLDEYRNKPAETERIADLMRLLPDGLENAIDIGARDGYISRAISERVPAVTALDLAPLDFDYPGVTCVQGDATALKFDSQTFDLVFCAEVLEHIPSPALEIACAELARVARKYVLIGVPYKQDIRDAKTTCYTCGGINPPWAHVNSFDESRLAALFPTLRIAAISHVGIGTHGTNSLSAALTTFAGNPFGTYVQDEPCIHCNSKLILPPTRTFAQKIATKAAVCINRVQSLIRKPQHNWIHVLFSKDIFQS